MEIVDRTQKTDAPPQLPFVVRDMPEGVTSKRETKGTNGTSVVIEECKGFQLITTKKGVMFMPKDEVAEVIVRVLGHGIDHGEQEKILGRETHRQVGDSCTRYWLKDVTAVAAKVLPRLREEEDCDEAAIYLHSIAEEINAEAQARIAAESKIRWDDLGTYLREGTEVYVTGGLPNDPMSMLDAVFGDGEGDSGTKTPDYGGVVINAEKKGFFFRWWEITVARFEQVGEQIEAKTHKVMVLSWRGSKPLSELPVRRISAEQKAEFAARGERWWEMVRKPSYLGYHGSIRVPSWRGFFERNADGRIMVDGSGFRRFAEGHFNHVVRNFQDLPGDHTLRQFTNALGPDQFWMTSTTVYGFSMRHRAWGQFEVGGTHEPHFRKDAIKDLVLDQDRKDLLIALVEHSQLGFQDIVDGKGGGVIILLHGEPGTGKTLTAEAVADHLQRPLYMISVGELGTNPAELEKKLRQILELAASWNAVVLLDEADIFMEKRTSGPGAIERNAMVAIFLRTLEYHSGVMFLTTNRDQEFDPAFHSRISVTLEYGKMDNATRAQVWTNLLKAAKIDGVDAKALSRVAPLNGRQIKNSIRSATILAGAQSRPVTMDDFRRVIPLAAGTVGKKVRRSRTAK